MAAPHPPAPRTSIPPRLARRIDRLARHAHAFHRWAHHPLCADYEGEVIRVGRRLRLCRGCALAALGGLAGILTGSLVTPLPPVGLLALAGFGALAGWLALSQRRRSKWATRALPATLLGVIVLMALRRGDGLSWAVACLAIATAMATYGAYRHRGPDRTPCRACPEFGAPGTCRGFRDIRRRERAFARLASRWLRAGDPVR